MRLAICFGGTKEMYFKHAKVLESLAKHFKRKSKFIFKQDKNEIKVFFALGPRKDELRKKINHDVRHYNKETPSPPASEIVKEIKKYKADKVLFFGICGGINNLQLNDVVYLEEFKEISAKKEYELHKQDLTPKKTVHIKNLLGSSKHPTLTTNLFFDKGRIGYSKKSKKWDRQWPEIMSEIKKLGLHIDGDDAGKLWCMLKFHEEFLPWLRKQGDLIDMESAVFAQYFKKKIGIMLQVSDIVGKKKLTNQREHVDWKKFNKNIVMNIKKILA
jgi:purine-nucleoside phosphorylase